ncbi:MAG TPA: hypothetical protein DIS66_05640 [Candidatus Omnitrophica bacterium]|mgnify:FL=1|nr:hypothetical protein [Candidatus Omnitrophota bacterium]
MADSSASLSPEKRLLQLIEGGSPGAAEASNAPSSPSGKDGKARKTPKPSFKMPPKTPAEWIAFLKEKSQKFFSDFRSKFSLKTANKTAQIGLVLLAVVALGNTAYEMKLSSGDPLNGLDVAMRKMVPIDLDESIFESSVAQKPEARNVFLPFAKREEIQATQKTVTGSGKLIEMTKNFKLTGISFDPENVKAAYCMIEDLQKSITSFLRVGDRISGVKVSGILDDRVELEYEGEKFEIH